MQSDNEPGWPDNDGLDHLSRAPVCVCNGKLEFVNINWTPYRWAPHPSFDTYMVSVRGGQGRVNTISV